MKVVFDYITALVIFQLGCALFFFFFCTKTKEYEKNYLEGYYVT